MDWKIEHKNWGSEFCWEKLAEVLKESHLKLFRQAIVDPETKEIIGYEILARVQKENWEFAHLGNFFKLIEDLDLEKEFDLFFLDKSLARLAETNDNLPYHINVYPKTLLSFWFEGFLQKLCETYNIESSRIIIEIIESGEPLKVVIEKLKLKVMQLLQTEQERIQFQGWFKNQQPSESASPEVVKLLNEKILSLKKRWFAVFIDDYPSGNNTKELVHELKNIKGIKIDGNLIKHLYQQMTLAWFKSFLEDLIKEIKELHGNENLEIVVEHVENQEILNLLSSIPDITGYQGYHFSTPDNF